MSEITVTVNGIPPNGRYSSSSQNVQPNGTITVLPGTTTIHFVRGSSEAWQFESPWITFKPKGPFRLLDKNADQLTVEDKTLGAADATFAYTLHTTQGNFDLSEEKKGARPEIINKGDGGSGKA